MKKRIKIRSKILSTIFLSMLLGNMTSPLCHCETTLGASQGQSNGTAAQPRTNPPETVPGQNEDPIQTQRERVYAIIQSFAQQERNDIQTRNLQRAARRTLAEDSNPSGGSTRNFGTTTNTFQQSRNATQISNPLRETSNSSPENVCQDVLRDLDSIARDLQQIRVLVQNLAEQMTQQ